MTEIENSVGLAVKLLRIIWVYLDHGGVGKGVDQGELPEEFADQLYKKAPEKGYMPKDKKGKQVVVDLSDKEQHENKPNEPLTYDDVLYALTGLEKIFEKLKDEGKEEFESPWPHSNPCAGPRPKYRA